MGEHIAAGDQIDLSHFVAELIDNLRTERPRYDVSALLARHFGDIGREVHANGTDGVLLQRSDECAVVAAELYDGLGLEFLGDPLGVVLKVPDQSRDGPSGERVVLEQDVRVNG